MASKGRHSEEAGNFYRDLVIMILAILGVGALVFFLLFLFADDTASLTTTTSSTSSTSTTLGQASTSSPSSTTSSTTTSTTIPVRANEDVRVVVLNSIGVAGVAGSFTQELAELGYQTLQADDYRPEQDPTRIWYREGFSAEANKLAGYMLEDSGTETVVEPLPDETLKPGADLIVVLGTGYQE